MSVKPYPYVYCDLHPNDPVEPGYVVCACVAIDGFKPAYVEKATTKKLGIILCQFCAPRINELLDSGVLILTCAHSVREAGILETVKPQ